MHNRKRTAVPVLALCGIIGLFPVQTAYAGSINSNEAAVLGALEGEFTYDGSVYVVDPAYKEALRAYFAEDGVDLTAEEKEQCINGITGNVGEAVAEGCMIKVRDVPKEDKKDTQHNTETGGNAKEDDNASTATENPAKLTEEEKERLKEKWQTEISDIEEKAEQVKRGENINGNPPAISGADVFGAAAEYGNYPGFQNNGSNTSNSNVPSSNTQGSPLLINSGSANGNRQTGSNSQTQPYDNGGNQSYSIGNGNDYGIGNNSNSTNNSNTSNSSTNNNSNNSYDIGNNNNNSNSVSNNSSNHNQTSYSSTSNNSSSKNKKTENKIQEITQNLAYKAENHADTIVKTVCILAAATAILYAVFRAWRKRPTLKQDNYTDIHSHILPGVDDGAQDVETSLDMLRLAEKQGIHTIIATPHYRAGRHKKTPEELQAIQKQMQEEADKEGIDVEILLGNELYYSKDICHRLDEKKALTLAGTRYVLVEFSPDEPYDGLYRGLRELIQGGYVPILAHMERYACLHKEKKKEKIEELIRMGVYMQMNIQSLNTHYCRTLVRDGYIHFFGSDSHNTKKRSPKMQDGIAELGRMVTKEQMEKILVENPAMLREDRYIA